MDRYFLEEFLQTMLNQTPKSPHNLLYVDVMIDRIPGRQELPEDLEDLRLAGIIDSAWPWPDPRRILSKLHYTIIEANGLPLSIAAVADF